MSSSWTKAITASHLGKSNEKMHHFLLVLFRILFAVLEKGRSSFGRCLSRNKRCLVMFGVIFRFGEMN